MYADKSRYHTKSNGTHARLQRGNQGLKTRHSRSFTFREKGCMLNTEINRRRLTSMKTAVIYARYSSERQTEQSIEGQLRECMAYAEQHDMMVVDTYISIPRM